jgi:CBS domain-containing protein
MSKPHTDLVVVCSHGDMVGVVTKTDIVRQISRCTGFGCTTRVESVMRCYLLPSKRVAA